jgi:RNA polymerase sigma factor (sigma-70 family)
LAEKRIASVIGGRAAPRAAYKADKHTWAKPDKKAVLLCLEKKSGDNGGSGAGTLIQVTERETATPDRAERREARPVETKPDSNSTHSVTRLINCIRDGNSDSADEAAQQVWERYLPQLLTLARCRLDQRIRGLHHEEDVVQSMGRSFFRRLRRGDFDLTGRDELWALLVTITLNKVRNTADRLFAAKRDLRRNQPLSSSDESQSDGPREPIALISAEPTPAEAAALNEALERRLQDLDNTDIRGLELRKVALMKLEGYTNQEIAAELKCGNRTVERKLGLIRKRWEAAIEDAV